MTDVPQTAIDAARAALIADYDVPDEQLDSAWLNRDVRVALTAAAPLIAAAERERVIALAQDRGARYPVSFTMGDGSRSVGSQPFADLLRVPDAEA